MVEAVFEGRAKHWELKGKAKWTDEKVKIKIGKI